MAKKILIVDDSLIARKILKSCLPKDLEVELFEAEDGLSGYQQFEAVHPDITFMDLTMPVMNGLEALEKIRQSDPKAVLVVVSADVQPKTQERIRNLGAFGVLRKPLTQKTVAGILWEIEDRNRE